MPHIHELAIGIAAYTCTCQRHCRIYMNLAAALPHIHELVSGIAAYTYTSRRVNVSSAATTVQVVALHSKVCFRKHGSGIGVFHRQDAQAWNEDADEASWRMAMSRIPMAVCRRFSPTRRGNLDVEAMQHVESWKYKLTVTKELWRRRSEACESLAVAWWRRVQRP